MKIPKQYHLSESQIDSIHEMKGLHHGTKPEGFWFTPDPELWEDIGRDLRRYKKNSFLYKVILEKDAKVLKLETKEEIEEFANTYYDEKLSRINWDAVALDYDGIYIHNHNTFFGYILGDDAEYVDKYGWYLHWDLDSGVVWNHKAIKKIKKVKHEN